MKREAMNPKIRHLFFINASPETIVDALMREEHIQEWWTKEARVEEGKGILGWSKCGWTVELDMKQDTKTRTVVWNCTKSNMQNPNTWEGTTITFTLTPEKHGTHLDFTQREYRDSPCYDICTQDWEFFIGTSLKRYLETGKGMPYPEVLETNEV
jgi:uncharacterized protein YndB with AHSA1/START domain